MKTDAPLSVERARIERVLAALAQATLGNYDARVEVDENTDEFLELEVALNILLDELALTRAQGLTQEQQIQQQAALLAQQHRELLRALSTPIIVVSPGVLALPIIGAVEAERAAQMSESMLARVVSERASHVILDLTGAGAIESETARSLLRMASAVRMLGARCLLTGISAEMARTLVQLDFDTADVQVLPQLSDALLRVFADKGQRLRSSAPAPDTTRGR